jgi:HemY protein
MRLLFGLLVVAALVAAAVFFADHPGRVEILWRGWQIETTVGVLTAVAALAALAAGLAIRVLRLIVGSPKALVRRRRERRRRAGYRALTRGMVAVAAGDPREAQRCARKAETLSADPPLTLLLSAQAAQLDGDEAAAKKYFTAMLDRPETEFLGLRGLLNQALREGDRDAALRLAERARELRPNAGWVSLSLLDLEARDGRWAQARATIAHAAKQRIIDPDRARHHRGVVLYELGRAALGNGDRRRALSLAAEARALTPDLAAPAAHYARLLLEDGRARAAAKAVERAWRTAPQAELAEVYRAIHAAETPLARVKSFERLAAESPAARESHLALAEAALDAQLWGEAHRHLERALTAPPPGRGNADGASIAVAAGVPTPRICVLTARLEEAEPGDHRSNREWLDRAAAAMPDPCWVCADCGGASPVWRSLCPHCGAFDTLGWRTPAHGGPVEAGQAVADLAAPAPRSTAPPTKSTADTITAAALSTPRISPSPTPTSRRSTD